MLAIILSPIYFIICLYILKRSMQWMQSCSDFFHLKHFKIVYTIILIFFVISPAIAFLLPVSDFQRGLQILSNCWFGAFIYTALFMVTAELIRLILKWTGKIPKGRVKSSRSFTAIGCILTVFIVTITVYGFMHSKNVQPEYYGVNIDKQCRGNETMNIVLAADFHFGYNSDTEQLTDAVNEINRMDADIVCIAGDIFDNEYDAIKDPEKYIEILKKIRSRYGVYACYGNHDIEEPIFLGFTFWGREVEESDPRMDEFLEKADIKLLQDQTELIDDSFYLVGRLDAQKPGRMAKVRKTAAEMLDPLDKDLPIIVMDHEPSDLENLAEAGADMTLSGHTHDGQIFPLNLTSRLIWDNSRGRIEVGGMTSVVTSGIGVFGPDMRVGTNSEVVLIKTRFESDAAREGND